MLLFLLESTGWCFFSQLHHTVEIRDFDGHGCTVALTCIQSFLRDFLAFLETNLLHGSVSSKRANRSGILISQLIFVRVQFEFSGDRLLTFQIQGCLIVFRLRVGCVAANHGFLVF
jgi:hypothetical protein